MSKAGLDRLKALSASRKVEQAPQDDASDSEASGVAGIAIAAAKQTLTRRPASATTPKAIKPAIRRVRIAGMEAIAPSSKHILISHPSIIDVFSSTIRIVYGRSTFLTTQHALRKPIYVDHVVRLSPGLQDAAPQHHSQPSTPRSGAIVRVPTVPPADGGRIHRRPEPVDQVPADVALPPPAGTTSPRESSARGPSGSVVAAGGGAGDVARSSTGSKLISNVNRIIRSSGAAVAVPEADAVGRLRHSLHVRHCSAHKCSTTRFSYWEMCT